MFAIMTEIEQIQFYIKNDSKGKLDLPFVNLERLTLNEVILAGVNFEGANLEGAVLFCVDFRGANLKEINLSKSKLCCCHFDDANLSGSNLSNSEISLCGFDKSNLSNANLSDCIIFFSDYIETNLSHANLSRADLGNSEICRSNLQYANLNGSDLSNVDFSDSDLSDTDLSNANLKYSNLYNVNIIGANFSGAIICETDIENATIIGENNINKILIQPYIPPVHKELSFTFNSTEFIQYNFDLQTVESSIAIKEISKIRIETNVYRESVTYLLSIESINLELDKYMSKIDLTNYSLCISDENEFLVKMVGCQEDECGNSIPFYGLIIHFSKDNHVIKCILQCYPARVNIEFM